MHPQFTGQSVDAVCSMRILRLFGIRAGRFVGPTDEAPASPAGSGIAASTVLAHSRCTATKARAASKSSLEQISIPTGA